MKVKEFIEELKKLNPEYEIHFSVHEKEATQGWLNYTHFSYDSFDESHGERVSTVFFDED